MAAGSASCPSGSVFSVASGLCIDQSGSGLISWYSASAQCVNKALRLPNYGELEYLRQNSAAFGLTFNQAGGMYWTADHAGLNAALVINMANGSTVNYTASNASAASWCVK